MSPADTYSSWTVVGTVERLPESLVMALWLAFLHPHHEQQ